VIGLIQRAVIHWLAQLRARGESEACADPDRQKENRSLANRRDCEWDWERKPQIFFFQAEDGIRDGHVTGVQTCALPISDRALALCDDPNAMIEVKSADTTKHPPLDVEEIVVGQRTRQGQSSVAAPPPPEPVAPTSPTI